jgi:hypothetical protein
MIKVNIFKFDIMPTTEQIENAIRFDNNKPKDGGRLEFLNYNLIWNEALDSWFLYTNFKIVP